MRSTLCHALSCGDSIGSSKRRGKTRYSQNAPHLPITEGKSATNEYARRRCKANLAATRRFDKPAVDARRRATARVRINHQSRMVKKCPDSRRWALELRPKMSNCGKQCQSVWHFQRLQSVGRLSRCLYFKRRACLSVGCQDREH